MYVGGTPYAGGVAALVIVGGGVGTLCASLRVFCPVRVPCVHASRLPQVRSIIKLRTVAPFLVWFTSELAFT